MQVDVWVKETEDGLDVRVKTSGVHLPLTGSEAVVVKQGYTELGNERDTLIVGPCFGGHRFIQGKEDSEAKIPGAATVYLTDYTPFDHEIRIRDKMAGNGGTGGEKP